MDTKHQIELLVQRLAELKLRQDWLSNDIKKIEADLQQLLVEKPKKDLIAPIDIEPPKSAEAESPVTTVSTEIPVVNASTIPVLATKPVQSKPAVLQSNFEEFVGGNIASKIGILITIIGVFIGAKYAIDRDLISPLLRIVLGYVVGGALIFFAIRLRRKYENFSAVLIGGGLAVSYFITYIAFSFYELIPQIPAFGLMLLFTIATVYAALKYDRVLIAHLGLVGAYAIPLLLSAGGEKYAILFSYITLINLGILYISFKRNWKSLCYLTYVLTWGTFSFWLVVRYDRHEHFRMAFFFLTMFFLIFYFTFLAYKLVKKENYVVNDLLLILSNSFVFYGLGFYLLEYFPESSHAKGIYTLANAMLHGAVCFVVWRMKLADKALFRFISGLGVVFAGIAVPVEFSGNWITLLWAAEALLLFWIGRTKNAILYEGLSAILIILSFVSLFFDWGFQVDIYSESSLSSSVRPFGNIVFYSSLLVCLTYGVIVYLNLKFRRHFAWQETLNAAFWNVISSAILILAIYLTFFHETKLFFDHQLSQFESSKLLYAAWTNLSDSWSINYSVGYLILLSGLNVWKLKFEKFARVLLALSFVATFFSLLWIISTYANWWRTYFGLSAAEKEIYPTSPVLQRYISIVFLGLLLYLAYTQLQISAVKKVILNGFHLLVHLVVLSLISSEFALWIERAGYKNQYKMGLSIIWAVYALYLIVVGISRKKKYLRLGAIVLFAITLVKLFVYDVADLSTVGKTITMISVGAILLIVSYLYNRYKHILFQQEEQT